LTSLPPPDAITWIKVDRLTFDLAGVLLSSLKFTVIVMLCGFLLGALLGTVFILRSRRAASEFDRLSLDIDPHQS